MQLGVIADDYTGATDLAGMLARLGLRAVQHLGVPDEPDASGADVVVVALKSRSIPAADAVAESVAAGRWLLEQGAQLFFKYCSTFDSTDRGNIGPVAVALADLVDASPSSSPPRCPRTAAPSTAPTCSCTTSCSPSRRSVTTRSTRCATPTSVECCARRSTSRSPRCTSTSSLAARTRSARPSPPRPAQDPDS